MKEKAPLYTN